VIAAAVVATDVCTSFDQISKQNLTSGTIVSGVLGTFIGQWGSNCTAYGEVQNAAIQTLNSYETSFCTQYNQLCSLGAIQGCSSCTATNATDYPALVDNARIADTLSCPNARCPSGSCSGSSSCVVQERTMTDCASNCLNSTLKNYTNLAVTAANALELVDALIAEIGPYLGCQLISKFVNYVQEPLCSSFLDGASEIVISSAVIGILLISFNIAILFSIDEFDPSKGLPEELTIDKPGWSPTWNKMRFGTIGFTHVTPIAFHRNAEDLFTPSAPPDTAGIDNTDERFRPSSSIKKKGGFTIGRAFNVTRFETVSAPPVDFNMDMLADSGKHKSDQQ